MGITFWIIGNVFALYCFDLCILLVTAWVARLCHYNQRDESDVYRDNEFSSKTVGEGIVQDSYKFELYPVVVLQIPMYNEDEYCEEVIEICTRLDWPIESLIIQVCDDSTKPEIIDKVAKFVQRKQAEGHFNLRLNRRPDRIGFKAGAMIAGMKNLKADNIDYKYICVMDADFAPSPDFLKKTIPKLERNPKLGFVQTRWVYTNIDSFLTWFQAVNLGFHFRVEQYARSFNGTFFGFNGTGGVWRRTAIEEVGGWSTVSVVEDMDLSLRTYLAGWEFTYINNITVPCELPGTHAAYRTQQWRWLSGPMAIFREALFKIYWTKNIAWWKRLSCYWFFIRFVLFQLLTLASLLCLPIIIWIEPFRFDASCWYFIAMLNFGYLPYITETPLSPLFMLLSIGFGLYKGVAMVAGILDMASSKTWVVTAKVNKQNLGTKMNEEAKIRTFTEKCLNEPVWVKLYNSFYFVEGVAASYYLVIIGLCTSMQQYLVVIFAVVASIVFLYCSWGDRNPCPSPYSLFPRFLLFWPWSGGLRKTATATATCPNSVRINAISRLPNILNEDALDGYRTVSVVTHDSANEVDVAILDGTIIDF